MMKFKALAISCVVFTMVGCAQVPIQQGTVITEETSNAPAPSVPIDGIKKYLNSALKDPFSAQIEGVSEPTRGFVKETTMISPPGVFTGSPGKWKELRRWGWIVTARVNAKNSYGGYTGWNDYMFVFRGDEIIFAENKTLKEEKSRQAVDKFLEMKTK